MRSGDERERRGERKGREEQEEEGNLGIFGKKNYGENLTELTAVAKKSNVCEM